MQAKQQKKIVKSNQQVVKKEKKLIKKLDANLAKKNFKSSNNKSKRKLKPSSSLVKKILANDCAKLTENVALPAVAPAIRLPSAFTTAPTAVAGPWARIDAAIGDDNVGFAAVFRDSVRAAVIYSENQTATYIAYGVDQASSVTNPAITSQMNLALVQDGQNWLPVRFFQYDSGAKVHGQVMACGTQSQVPAARFVWMNKGDILTTTFFTGANITFVYSVLRGIESGVVNCYNNSLTVNNNTQTATFTASDSGYYAGLLASVSSAVQITLTATLQVGAGGSYIYRQLMLPDLDKHLGAIETTRIMGVSLMFTNTTATLQNGGQVTMFQAPENTHWFDYTGDNGTVIDAFSAISNRNGSAAADVRKGMFGFLKPTKPADFDFQSSFLFENDILQDTFFPIFPKTAFLVCGFSGAASDNPLAGYYTMAFNVEFQTVDVWFPVDAPTVQSDSFDEAMNVVKTLPQFHENPLHFAEIWSGIKKGVKSVANFASDAIRWTVSNAPTLMGIAKGISTLL